MLRNITIGRYYPADSPLHKADARTKIISSIAFAAMVFACDAPAALLALGAFAAAATVIGHIPIKYILNGLKPLRWFILFTMIVSYRGSGRHGPQVSFHSSRSWYPTS